MDPKLNLLSGFPPRVSCACSVRIKQNALTAGHLAGVIATPNNQGTVVSERDLEFRVCW